MSNLQGRHSVDFRFNPSNKNLNLPRNTASSQSNHITKGFNNPRQKSSHPHPSKKKRSQTESNYFCKSAPLKQLFSTIIRLEKQRSTFGSHLQQVQRITKIIDELHYVPVNLCHKLIRVIASKQLTEIFPQVGRLVSSVIDALGFPKGNENINKILTQDIHKLQRELRDLKQQEQDMKNTFDQDSRIRSRKIQQLLETVELQNLELQKLRKKGQTSLQETKQKLSNLRYK